MKNFIKIDDRIININSIRHVRNYLNGSYKSRIAYIGLPENTCCFASALTVDEVSTLIEEAQNPKKKKK